MIIEAEAGESIHQFVKRVLETISYYSGTKIVAHHNAIEVNVYHGSTFYDILEKFDLKHEIQRLKNT